MNHIITYNINIKSKRDYLLTVRWTQSEWRDKCWEQVYTHKMWEELHTALVLTLTSMVLQ